MPGGVVKWFNRAAGYGFIVPDDGSSSVYVPLSSVHAAGLRDLNEGQRLNYALVRVTGKYVAKDLDLIGADQLS
jgi:CspA family cold shock protein